MSEQEISQSNDAVPEATEAARLRRELAGRDTYIHELHLAREVDQIALRKASRDLEDFVRWLAAAEDEREGWKARAAASAEKQGLAGSMRSLFTKRKKAAHPAPGSAAAPGAPFRYYLKTSPYRVHREPAFILEGWALPESGAAVTGLRARVDDEAFFGTYALEEPFDAAWHDVQPNNPRPGFKIVIEIPPGRHRLSLEAQLGGSEWFSILTTPLWSVPAERRGR